ncbi:MAG TPA: bifunctional serine/threonine-protein kinase/ABC transporter substrate-binding protein [Kofleriaceae bacterium]|nr:bifunctional serine/threonine-protein kinase/ABC transporter substrate-binding protein [Kofleriaceae bacterium]
MPPLLAGSPDDVLGRYRLFAKLGSGGQADVFLAIARGTLGVDKLVVIKRARPGLAGDGEQLGAFLDEARLALRLNHPNLVHTYEVGEAMGAHFISMEHVEGLSLKELFRSPRTESFAPAIWLRVVADALSGLSHAHGLRDYDGKPLGVVHRDISPHNIVVSYDGVTKLLDFGIASSIASHGAGEPGAVTGKAAYMAPEQALGRPDRRSDLFAMGVVLWEMLAGRRLFEGDSAEILRRLAEDPIPRLASCVPDLDPELDGLVARALEKDPAARFQTANEMRQAIERHLRKAGHVVRELEVGEAISTAFADVRAALQARIREAMATTGELPGLAAGDPEATPQLARTRVPRPPRPMPQVPQTLPSGAAFAAPLAPLAGRAALPAASGARVNRALAITAALGLVAALASAITLASRRGDPGGEAMRAAVARPAAELARPACTTPIRVRVMYDMTGSTKDVGTPAGKGEHDYLRAINAAGGIRGCKLDIDVQDTHYDKRASLDVYARWKASPGWAEVSTLFVQGTPMTQALGPLAAGDGKVILSGAYAGELAAPAPTSVDVAVPSLGGGFAEASLPVKKQSPGYANVFFQGTDYTTAARVAANFAWRQGARRMAFFYCSTSAFCTEPVDGAKTFLKQLGGTRIGRDLFIELEDDTATVERKVVQFFHEERLYKAAHPDYEIADWIWFGNTSTNTASLGRALRKARDQLRLEVHVIGNNWSLDETLYRRCGDACIGFDVVQPFGLFGDPTASGTPALLADHATYRTLDGDSPDAYQTVQYVYGRVAVAAWKIAVERVLDQGKPVTGANLREALEAFRHVDVEGFATIDYSPIDHRPQSGARITRLGPRGRMETIGQPLSLSLQSGWLGW